MSETDTDLETASQDDTPNPWDDHDAWTDLSREEQSALLDEGLADLKGETDGDDWRHLDDGAKRDTIEAIERDADALSDTERAMQAALQQTWTAEIFTHNDTFPTVPFECRELTASEKDQLDDAGRVMMMVEDRAEEFDDPDDVDLSDLDAIDIDSEHFDTLGDVERWTWELLGSVTMDAAFDADRFRTGENLLPNTRHLLFLEVFLRYDEESSRAVKFRTESAR